MYKQFYDLEPGQTVTIGESRVTLEAKSGRKAKLKIESNEPTSLGKPERAIPRPFAPSKSEVAAETDSARPLQRPSFAGMPTG